MVGIDNSKIPHDKSSLPSIVDKAGKKIVLLTAYLIALPIFIIIVVAYQMFLINQSTRHYSNVLGASTGSAEYKALPENRVLITESLFPKEARVDVLEQFLNGYNSTLAKHSKKIVEYADKYKIDYRLIPAIAMQESTLCKKIIKDSYNCWGFGIYGNKVTKFANFDEAIETVTRTLAREYIQKGLIEPDEIMSKYSPQNHNDWAGNVNLVMEQIENAL